MKLLNETWSADPTQPGRIGVGDAITIEVQVAFWRVLGPDGKTWSESESLRLVKEAEALCLAAPDMAKALLAIRERVGQAGLAMPRQRSPEEMVKTETDIPIPASVLREVFAALAKAGVTIP